MLGLCVVLSACEPGILNPAGPIAAGERSIFFNALAVMLAIVVPVIILALPSAGGSRGQHPRQASARMGLFGAAGIAGLVDPALAIMFLGGIAWIGSHDLDPPKPIASKARR